MTRNIRADAHRPLARSEQLVIETLDDELLVYDLRSQRCHALNGVAARIFNHCDGTRSIADLAAIIDAPDRETAQQTVWLALKQLDQRKLLADDPGVPGGTDRRQLLRRAALAGSAVLAIPLIRSINAPAAAQAASCLPKFGPCAVDSQCCSGRCLPSGFCQ